LKAIAENKFPLDVKGVKLNLQVDEIVDFIKKTEIVNITKTKRVV